ncbi:MAG TPA: hypothetical protein PKE06_16785 [Flavilitoribacter sp.]|nr:hypothetical protein [Flavilitoribacter sp.]HMQ91036.1 hypothetical protein [Flavilitoribacter sp.]
MTASSLPVFFWICWSVDLLALLGALIFFLQSAARGAYYPAKFYTLWSVIILGLAGIIWGAPELMKQGFTAIGWMITGAPAALLGLYGLFLLVVVSSGGKWN